jgi:hypothetical protein
LRCLIAHWERPEGGYYDVGDCLNIDLLSAIDLFVYAPFGLHFIVFARIADA